MKHFTTTEKQNGERAIRGLSEAAQRFYDGTKPLDVYDKTKEDEQ